MNLIAVENAGQRIIKTNYWDSEDQHAGLFYLSWNAGAARLLVPDAQQPALTEMHSARMVIVSRGPLVNPRTGHPSDALELLFEDDTESPYVLHIAMEQTDRMLPPDNQGGGFIFAAWTRGGLKHTWPGKYRTVESLPCLDAWTEQ